jgi:hypothetical protein
VAAGHEQRRERHRDAPRAQRVRLQRLAHDIEVGGQDALPGVVVDRGVVDEHVELADLTPQGADRRLVGHVEPDGAQIAIRHRGRVARAREHGEPAVAQLPRDLQPDPAVGAGDERNRHSLERTEIAAAPRTGAAADPSYEALTSDCAAEDSSRMTSACADAGALAGGVCV